MRQVRRFGVVGAGTMGASIAQVIAAAGFPVELYDVAEQQLTRGHDGIRGSLARFVKRGTLSETDAAAVLKCVDLTTDLQRLEQVDVVVEAAPEDLELKRSIFGQLGRICPPDSMLASNTSSLNLTAIAAAVERPERFVGLHFFNPPVMMPLVEVGRAAQTAPEVVGAAVELMRRLGKTPVEVSDTPGFIVNRIARPFYLEGSRILGEGLADAPTIDRVMRLGGFRMGPFELMDLVGIDVNYAVTRSVYEQTFQDPRYRPHPIQRQQVLANRLGRKTGRGFYDYNAASTAPPEPPATPPDQGIAGQVAVIGDGDLAAALRQLAEQAGLKLLEEPSQAAIVVVAGQGYLEVRRLGLRNVLEKADQQAAVLAYCAPWTVTEITSTLRRTERVAGFALTGDPASVRLVEVAGGLNSDQRAVDAALRFFAALGKEPVQVGDGPGMVLGRIVSLLVNEAAAALDEGIASPRDIDAAMKLGVAYPFGPLEWGDQLGLDQVFQTVRVLQQEYGDRYRPAIRLRRLVQAGRLGRKSGGGFF